MNVEIELNDNNDNNNNNAKLSVEFKCSPISNGNNNIDDKNNNNNNKNIAYANNACIVSEQSPPAKRVHWGRKLAYGVGFFPANMVLMPLMLYFNYFALETVKLNPSVTGLIINIAIITDAVSDPICGLLINWTRSRFGRYKPWMFLSVPLLLVVFVMCFYYPASVLTTQTFKLIYYMTMNFAARIFCTTYLIPYMAMIMSLTKDPRERQEFICVQTFCQMLSSILSMLTFGKITDVKRIEMLKMNYANVTGWPDAAAIHDERQYYIYASLVSGAIIFFSAYVCIFGSKETNRAVNEQNNSSDDPPKYSKNNKRFVCSSTKQFFSNIKSVLFFRDYLLFIVLGVVNAFTGSIALMGFSFYALYTVAYPLHVSNLMSVYMTVPIFVIVPAQFLMKFIGLKITGIIGFLIYIPSALIFFFLPGSAHVGWLYLLAVLNGLSFGILTFSLFSIIPYLIDAYKSKKEKSAGVALPDGGSNELLFYSFFVFFLKVGASLAPLLINCIIEAFGYNQSKFVQPPSVGKALRYIMLVTQLALTGLCILCFGYISIQDKPRCTAIGGKLRRFICRGKTAPIEAAQ